jgi:hypothetical protein
MTRQWIALSGLVLSGLLIGNAFAADSGTKPTSPVLTACGEATYKLFTAPSYASSCAVSAQGDTELEKWAALYHGTAKKVLEEDSAPPGANTPPFTCTGEDYAEFLKPRPCLKALAGALPTWEAGEISNLSQADIGVVLLEYLRMYECTLVERGLFLPEKAEMTEGAEVTLFGVPYYVVDIGHKVARVFSERNLINQELSLARPTLRRVLSIGGNSPRIRVLEEEIKCIQQTSLDIRNGLALSAEASSCMPRIWNAKDILRDVKPAD